MLRPLLAALGLLVAGHAALPAQASDPLCPGVLAGLVDLCVAPEALVARLDVAPPQVGPAPVARLVAHVEAYRFTLATGGSARLPCVQFEAPPGPDACRLAGGVFEQRLLTLVDPASALGVSTGPAAATLAVCTARLTATVAGFGAERAAFVTAC